MNSTTDDGSIPKSSDEWLLPEQLPIIEHMAEQLAAKSNAVIAEDISLTKLIQQWMEAKRYGPMPKAAEVGWKTWKFLLRATDSPEDAIEGYFMGVAIRPGDVPEGKLWPLESAK